MIPQLRDYLMENWRDLPLDGPRPRHLDFLVQATGISKVCCYIFVDDEPRPRWVAKMPRSPRDNNILAHEYSVTQHLRQHGSEYLRATIAEPLLTTIIAGHLVGIEPYLSGRPMDGLMSVARDANAPEIVGNLQVGLDWLLRCQQSTTTGPIRLNEEQVESYLLAPIRYMKASSNLTVEEGAYLDGLAGQIKQLAHRPLPLVFKHGDLQPGNILVDDNSIHVIDWEFGAVAGLPLHDVFGFIARTYARFRGFEEMDGYIEDYLADLETVFFEGGAFAQVSTEHVDRACRALSVDPAWVRTLFGLFIVNEANKYYVLLTRRAERGYVYLLNSKEKQSTESYAQQLARQKQVWLLGHLARHQGRLIFPEAGAPGEWTPTRSRKAVGVA